MLNRLESDELVAGVNPFLLAEWLSTLEKRLAFMGLVFDFQKRLHYLYEGVLFDNELVMKERFFQIAHPGSLLIRSDDFRKVGGFKAELGFLAFPELSLQILHLRPLGYACVAGAYGRLRYKFDSWSFCGAWDSILQRGRLAVSRIKPDYADFCRADSIEYGCDSWLAEGPAQMPDLSDSPAERCWQEWRYHPKPATLLAFLASLPLEESLAGVELARNRPSSLPQTFQYYQVQADRVRREAGESRCAIISEIDKWLAKSRRFHYGELKPGIELVRKAGIYNCSLDICPAIFDAWVEIGENFERLEISESWPEIAVLMPVWNPKPDFLRQAIESVIKQTYPNWQLCIADDATTKREIRPLLENFANSYARIKIKFREQNGHICRASNTALEMVDAPFTAFLDHDDLLSPHALAEVAGLIAQKPELAFIYTDDDRINEFNVRRNPVFRPDFDCDLFYTGHLSTYNTQLIREIGGLRTGTEGAQDTDLRLRVTELLDNDRIAHIPRILYHWRVHEESTAGSLQAKPYVVEAGRKVYLEAAARQGRQADWGDGASPRLFRLLYYPIKRPLCAIIFLMEHRQPSERLLAEVRQLEQYADLKIYLQPLGDSSVNMASCTLLPHVSGGMACACNEAAARVNGEVLLFLAADLKPVYDCRLEQLLELAMMPHIAMASANIWQAGKLASGGWYPNENGLPFLLLQGMDRLEVKNSAWGQMYLPRHVLGAPWQCMAVKKEFCQTGKFLDESYGSFATVDFGLRAMQQNKFVAITPWVNWQTDVAPASPGEAELRFVIDNRGSEIAACGLRNPNLRAAPDNDWTINF
ncbi:MAG: glycosyltransferase [Desulfovibrio sp.]|nr:glycosyltransferase [Desulfovibrio sp.]